MPNPRPLYFLPAEYEPPEVPSLVVGALQGLPAALALLHSISSYSLARQNPRCSPSSRVLHLVSSCATLNCLSRSLSRAEKSSAADAQGGDGQGCSTKSRSDQANYARVGMGHSANSADDTSLAETMSRVLPHEPVHINPRNLSCNSLKSMGGLEEKEELPGDMDDARSPAADAKHVLTYASGSGQTPSPDHGDQQDRDAALSQAFTSVKDVMTVKNTFLDFGPMTSSHALRSVQTASGRLDLMYKADD